MGQHNWIFREYDEKYENVKMFEKAVIWNIVVSFFICRKMASAAYNITTCTFPYIFKIRHIISICMLTLYKSKCILHVGKLYLICQRNGTKYFFVFCFGTQSLTHTDTHTHYTSHAFPKLHT